MIVDNDLLSIQQARILAENARWAQQALAGLSQEQLDAIVDAVAAAIAPHARELAVRAQEETDYGRWQDKWVKNRFVCEAVPARLRGMRCVGVLSEDPARGLMTIGVPMGVLAAVCPVTSPVSTTIFKTLMAIKSGNAIIFSPHPRAMGCMGAALDIMMEAAHAAGLPEGCLGYLRAVSRGGTAELMGHPHVSLVLLTGAGGLYPLAQAAGKPVIYGGTGSGPAFVERSADIERAARDIILSKSFDHGMAPSAEQSIVADASISARLKDALTAHGAYFMTPEQSDVLAGLLFTQGGCRLRATVGLAAPQLAERAGFAVPEGTRVLVSEQTYVLQSGPYSHELLAPVLAYYVEDDWMHACEKCIELLLHERKSHTLVIHCNDADVVRQFALKKPVGRLLVNTPSVFGGMGLTTNLFPSPILGGASTGYGITADNVSPMNCIYVRTVGHHARDMRPQPHAAPAQHPHALTAQPAPALAAAPDRGADPASTLQVVQRLLQETVEALRGPAAR